MDLQEQIRTAIEKDLPAQVGNALKARLEKAERDENKLKRLEHDLEVERGAGRQTMSELKALKTLALVEQDLQKKDRELEIKEQLLTLKEAHTKELVTEIRGVVRDVFANNRYKYSTYGNTQRPDPTCPGATVSCSDDKQTEVEG